MGERKKIVLVIEDEEPLLRAIVRQLESVGWDVVGSTEPRGCALGYDVVLTDWRPHGSIMVTACRVAQVPVVVHTGTPDDVPIGIRSVVTKPATTEELDAALMKARGR